MRGACSRTRYRQNRVAVSRGDVTDEAVPVVVDEFVAKTALAELAHVLQRQQPAVEYGGTQDHGAMTVPTGVVHGLRLVLGDAFGEPHGHHGVGQRQDGESVGGAGENVVPVRLFLVAEVLQEHGGHTLGSLAGGTQRDDVDELVGDDIMQPVGRTTQLEVVLEW